VNSNNHSAELSDTAAAIGALVRQLLPYGKISIENIAAHQRMSVRTLQRRLRDWGFAFEEIVDDVRRTEAIRHVLAGENSAMEIAFLLGYSDHSHLHAHSSAGRVWRREITSSLRLIERSTGEVMGHRCDFCLWHICDMHRLSPCPQYLQSGHVRRCYSSRHL
jgi:AraC-like DNA-binding protein